MRTRASKHIIIKMPLSKNTSVLMGYKSSSGAHSEGGYYYIEVVFMGAQTIQNHVFHKKHHGIKKHIELTKAPMN